MVLGKLIETNITNIRLVGNQDRLGMNITIQMGNIRLRSVKLCTPSTTVLCNNAVFALLQMILSRHRSILLLVCDSADLNFAQKVSFKLTICTS